MGVKKGVALNRSFTQIPNDLIRNREVSDGAFRLICWITSHTDGFDVSFSGIRAALGYGRDGLRSIIKNAEENNYLVRVRTRDEKTGQFDWDYHVFASQQDAIAFRESIDGLATPGVTIDGLAVGGSPTGGSATGGSDHPHKEYKDEEEQSKKEQSKNTPLTPKGEECVTRTVLAEVVETVAVEIEVLPEEDSNEQSNRPHETQEQLASLTKFNSIEGQDSGQARCNNKTLQKLIERFENGEITKLPSHELKMLADAVIGDYVAEYRQSGNINSANPNDIRPEFLAYVTSNHLSSKLRNSVNAFGRIRNIEQEPTQWRSLVEMVEGWLTRRRGSTFDERNQTPAQKTADFEDFMAELLSADA